MSDRKNPISCSVDTCKYNDKGAVCSLDTIQVSSCADAPSVKSAEQSMCASFDRGK